MRVIGPVCLVLAFCGSAWANGGGYEYLADKLPETVLRDMDCGIVEQGSATIYIETFRLVRKRTGGNRFDASGRLYAKDVVPVTMHRWAFGTVFPFPLSTFPIVERRVVGKGQDGRQEYLRIVYDCRKDLRAWIRRDAYVERLLLFGVGQKKDVETDLDLFFGGCTKRRVYKKPSYTSSFEVVTRDALAARNLRVMVVERRLGPWFLVRALDCDATDKDDFHKNRDSYWPILGWVPAIDPKGGPCKRFWLAGRHDCN